MSEMCMRLRMSEWDAYYSGRVVNGARNVTLMGDCATRLMAKDYGNIGRCVAIPKCRLYAPCFPGDYMEYHARVTGEEGNRVTMEVRCFKVAYVPKDPPCESSANIMETPELCLAAIMVYELPDKK